MPGVPRELAEHALNVDPAARPVQQAMRRLSEPERKAIGKEIQRLTEANFIREIKQSTWVSNPVMVPKKKTDILRMCIDFTDLNKHCPKDHFPLPRIDQIVDSTPGCECLSFLDAYSRYNQIRLKEEDQDKTTLHLLLQRHDIWIKKRRSHISENDASLPEGANRQERPGLYR